MKTVYFIIETQKNILILLKSQINKSDLQLSIILTNYTFLSISPETFLKIFEILMVVKITVMKY